MQEVVERLNGIKALAQAPLLLREVSAQLFWGMSKVLDNRQALVAALVEQSVCPFPESPVQLLVKLPQRPLTGVLFIENQMSFEQALKADAPSLKGLALVYASGFKGSARRLRTPLGASVYYSARCTGAPTQQAEFESWLFEQTGHTLPVFFWGDLDWSGMGILRALRNVFADARAWEPGYSPMLQSLREGQGHAPLESDKHGQVPLDATGCTYAGNVLIPELRATERFMDQEVVSLENV